MYVCLMFDKHCGSSVFFNKQLLLNYSDLLLQFYLQYFFNLTNEGV